MMSCATLLCVAFRNMLKTGILLYYILLCTYRETTLEFYCGVFEQRKLKHFMHTCIFYCTLVISVQVDLRLSPAILQLSTL